MKPATRDPALRGVLWRDLLTMSRRELAIELTLPLPWFVGSLMCYGMGWVVPGVVCSFFLFLTGLRLSHGCQHYHLPVGRRLQDTVLGALSLVMMSSMHAVQATHLNHHQHTLDEHDFEGSVARLPLWRALLFGPLFPIRLHLNAWRLARPAKRRWIAWEIAGVLAMAALLPVLPTALFWHVIAMLAGECWVGFFAVWTVHHHGEDGLESRTQRGRWMNAITYNMFLHTEHHLFPAVPTCHLHTLSGRLDQAAPRYQAARVFPSIGRRASHL